MTVIEKIKAVNNEYIECIESINDSELTKEKRDFIIHMLDNLFYFTNAFLKEKEIK